MAVRGADAVIRKLNQLPASLQRGISDALEASAAEMHGAAVTGVQRSGSSGRSYKRGKRTHIASAPGEFPNTDTGALASSMRWSLKGPLQAVWGAYILYAKYLEFGTSRIAARPFIRPTFRKYEAKAKERIRKAVAQALSRAANG